MDDLDKQLAELQLITKGELKKNYAVTNNPVKKVGPAVPPKPKKPQVYTNLPGVPRPYEKQPESIHSVHQHNTATYSNQDGLIYSNILHDKAKANAAAANHCRSSAVVVTDDFPPPPLEISPDYVQCNVPPPFPPPPIPSEVDDGLDDILPPPPPVLGVQTQPPIAGNILYTPMGGISNMHKTGYPQVDSGTTFARQMDPATYPAPSVMPYPTNSVSPTNIPYQQRTHQPYENYNETNFYANFNKAQPQVPTNYAKQATNYSMYSNMPAEVAQGNQSYGGHNYSNIQLTRNENPTYENTIIHQTPTTVGRAPSRDFTSDMHNSVLNYPGSSVSDYENQAQILENRGFRAGSSASNYVPNSEFNSRIDYDSDVRTGTRDPSQGYRSASSASNYLPQHGYDRYNDQAESLYAPLRRPTDNDLPPPPPIMGEKTLAPNLPPIIMCGGGGESLSNMGDEIPPPASPVSSSYSELRRATDLGGPHHHTMYNPYTPPSHISSTYESIYEPINPRPASQNSARSSGYSLYGGHQPPMGSGNISNSGTLPGANKQAKELEVDQLTDLLVQGLDSADQDDVYGICVKCNEKIVGEENGCTTMDHFYHIDCFTCCQCNNNLQGKPFYSVEGQPYCEQDYLNTLEKCSVCVEPILDRILRATGKPYHPQCFTCIVCNKSLDGVPFTVDATNQIHCIEDFHKKFAPRCCVCKLPIMPEHGEEETVRVVALDRSFHIGCYKCEDCGLVLSSEAEGRGCYPLDDHVLCKSCNAKRVQALTSHMTTEL